MATSTAFIGGAYSMDSTAFLLWAAQRYAAPDERFVAVVLLALIGSQEIGGHITRTQQELGQHLGYSRAHVAWAMALLMEDGVLRRVRRGVYQLVPSAVLRGGVRPSDSATPRELARRAARVHQLDLLKEILDDEDAPEAFRAMAQVDARLPDGPRRMPGHGEARA
ncbi:replication/maintenance protein RepL [Streptomyces virginiae]|uniref:replication/maintenance protein RepL n=1 Tax=Streptomyces virginiae TaxID=1961 RepID=UPI00224F9C4E|nr:replication/maintenance protein RepL [Streptomyces virginiae]MCX4721971.1 replication/maintenance protein RepL [Streptomyces virginiae]